METLDHEPMDEPLPYNPKIRELNKRNRARTNFRSAALAKRMNDPATAELTSERFDRRYKAVLNSNSPFERRRRFLLLENYESFAAEAELDVKTVKNALREKKGREQAVRAKASRTKIGDSEIPLKDLITVLNHNSENRKKNARDFMEDILFDALKEEGCSPKLLKDENGQPYIEYDYPNAKNKRDAEGHPVRSLKLGSLRNTLRTVRGHFKLATM